MAFVSDLATDLAEGTGLSSTPLQTAHFTISGWNEAKIKYDVGALEYSIRQEARQYKKEHLNAKILEYNNYIVDLERILNVIFGNENDMYVDYSQIRRVVDLFKDKVVSVTKQNQVSMLEEEERRYEVFDEEDDPNESVR